MHLHQDSSGSALVFALGFMTVVLVIALGVHTLVGVELRASGVQRRRVAAEYLAEGGLARTIAWFNTQGYRLPETTTFTGSVPVRLTSNNAEVVLPTNHPNNYTDTGGAARSGVVSSFNSLLTSQSLNGGSYSVTASLMGMQPETWEVVVTAQQGGIQRRVGGLLTREQTSFFSNALFGATGVSMNGNAMTDSYNSSQGAYGGSNRFATGSVGSNGNVTLSGNVTINGDAVPGPSNTVQLGGNSKVTGAMTPAATARTLDPITVPAGATNLGALSISGNNTYTLSSGTYVASSLTISGNAKIKIDATSGPVNLYVSGAINASGNGFWNTSGSPENLFIAQTVASTFSLSGNTDFYGSVYAPLSPLNISGNVQYFGAFVGSSVAISGNGNFHYDQALQSSGGAPGPLRLVAQWNLLS